MGWFDTLFVHIFTIGITQDVHELAWNGIWAATSDRNGVENGGYYEPVGIKPLLRDYRGDERLEERLWEWTERSLRNGCNVNKIDIGAIVLSFHFNAFKLEI